MELKEAIETFKVKSERPRSDDPEVAILCALVRHPRILDVLLERERQINVEGWTPEHDAQHDEGELAVAGACYLEEGGTNLTTEEDIEEEGVCPPSNWPWAKKWWKPTGGPERNLIKGCALGVAELERLDRSTAIGSLGWSSEPDYSR